MKKILSLLVLLLFCSLMSSAQDKAKRIQEIRKAYAEAKKDIAENGKNNNSRMDVRINFNDGAEVDEDFIINDESELNFYFKRMRLTTETDLFDPHCYFVVEKWSANGHSRYREILYDLITGHLMFSYLKSESHAGFVTESRYYYDDVGNLIEEKHKAGGEESGSGSPYSSGGDQTLAMKYMVIFDALMQQKGVEAENDVALQTNDQASRIKQIRSAYADAKQKIAKDAKSAIPRNMQVVIHDQEDPDLPPQTDEQNFWYERVNDEGENGLYFMSSKCNLGDHSVYSEYLFDPKTSQLMFCFSQQAQNDGPALEWRYYFDAKGQCIEAKGHADRNGPGFADKHAAAFYLELFNGFANPVE